MLKNIKEIYGNQLAALDGDIGHVKDFYFDDTTWVVRYLVANTGSWLAGRLVLISPLAFGKWNQEERTLHINMQKKQIEDSPPIESHKPVSRQYEKEYYRSFGWPAYWEGGGMWGAAGFPLIPPTTTMIKSPSQVRDSADDIHLRSMMAVTGYHIQSSGGTIGSVSGFMVDDQNWAIGELIVEIGHWYPGKKILIPLNKIERVSYEESIVYVNLSKEDIQRTAENEVAQVSAGGL
jgi:hypothetical protein